MSYYHIPVTLYIFFLFVFQIVVIIRKSVINQIRDHALNLISSYLYDGQQFVQFKDKTSNETIVKCDVPQGSILGPHYNLYK